MVWLLILQQGGLWLGFFQGGVAYFRDGQVRASYSAADGLGEGPVNDLRLDRDGTLWAATEGGLSRLKNGRIATLTSKNGLPCDAVHWTMEDDAQSFWLNTACGLVRIARSELDAWAARSDKRDANQDARHGFRQFGRSKEQCQCRRLQSRTSPSPRMENCGSRLRTASASSIRATFPSTNFRRRCTSKP